MSPSCEISAGPQAIFIDDLWPNNLDFVVDNLAKELYFLSVNERYITNDYDIFENMIKEHRAKCVAFVDVTMIHSSFERLPLPGEEAGLRILAQLETDFPEVPKFLYSAVWLEAWEKRAKEICPKVTYLKKGMRDNGMRIRNELLYKYNLHL